MLYVLILRTENGETEMMGYVFEFSDSETSEYTPVERKKGTDLKEIEVKDKKIRQYLMETI
jgi:hypothetical protein